MITNSYYSKCQCLVQLAAGFCCNLFIWSTLNRNILPAYQFPFKRGPVVAGQMCPRGVSCPEERFRPHGDSSCHWFTSPGSDCRWRAHRIALVVVILLIFCMGWAVGLVAFGHVDAVGWIITRLIAVRPCVLLFSMLFCWLWFKMLSHLSDILNASCVSAAKNKIICLKKI